MNQTENDKFVQEELPLEGENRKLTGHEKYVRYRIKDVEDAFKDHAATRHDLGGGVILIEWGRPNSSTYYVRYLFDTQGGNLTISGDCGFCVLHTAWGAVGMQPEHVAASFSHTNLHYFMEKVMAIEHKYTYNEESITDDIKEWLEEHRYEVAEMLEDSPFDDEIEKDEDGVVTEKAVDDEIKRIAEDLEQAVTTESGLEVGLVEDELRDKLSEIDSEWEYTLHDAGREYDAQIYYWVIGLRKAIQYLSAKDKVSKPAKEVVA